VLTICQYNCIFLIGNKRCLLRKNKVMTMYNFGNLRSVLMDLMKENNLSMRKLSEHTGIDTAVISKIINGKRKANLDHLYKFADTLNVPIARLIEAAGYHSDSADVHANHDPFSIVQDLLKNSDDITEEPTMKLIEERAAEYMDYSLTNEGKQTIFNHFKSKLENLQAKGAYIRQLEMMFERFRQKNRTKKEMMLMGGALIYFVVTMDVLPDYIFPVGYLDDAFVVQKTMQSLSQVKIR